MSVLRNRFIAKALTAPRFYALTNARPYHSLRPSPAHPQQLQPPSMTSSSDAEYASFLEQANAPLFTTSTTKTSSHPRINAATPPASLKNISRTYTSESDEPFEAVAVKYAGEALPAAGEAILSWGWDMLDSLNHC